MPKLLLPVLMFGAIPAGVSVAGATAAVIRTPSTRLRSIIQHFAAGVVAAAAAVELLPEDMGQHAPLALAAGFVLGTAAMLGLRKLMERFEGDDADPQEASLVASQAEAHRTGPQTMLGAVGVDVFIDGLLLGLAFVAGQKVGLLLTIGFSLEMLSLGLATCATCRSSRWTVRDSIASVIGLGLLLMLGASLAASVLGGLQGSILAGILAFGVAALLYLVTEELLVEAHEVKENTATTAMFFAAFLVLVMIDLLS